MKRSILAFGASVLATVAVLCFVASERKSALAQAPSPPLAPQTQSHPLAKGDHFLEVGLTYTFGWPSRPTAEHCKVLDGPRGDWVKVEIPRRGTEPGFVAWVDISKVLAIVPE